jgi:carboxypeptidase Q
MRNRSLRVVLVLLLGHLLLGPAVSWAKPKKSTPADRAKAVRLARELEADPLGEDAVDKRRWLIEWYTKVPDITVTVCDLLGPLPKDEHPFFSDVLVQSMFAGGAFIIEHPDQVGDQVAVQTAGIEGALKVYEIFVKAMPEGRLPFLDDLLAKRGDGTLRAHMKEAVAEGCK